MASNQVCSSSSLSDRNRRRSTAQMCLKKIVDFISSSRSSLEFESKLKVSSPETKVFDIDLNLRLGAWLESENENRGFSACSGVGEVDGGWVCGKVTVNCSSSVAFGDVSAVDKSSEGECDPKQVREDEDGRVDVEDETKELSEITNLEAKQTSVQKSEEAEEQSKLSRTRERKSQGYLDLLVEAARLVSGDFEDDDVDIPKKPSRAGQTKEKITESVRLESKVNHEEDWMLYGDFEDISPIVRSKRGRNQVLPFRYRDSVLEPWKRLTKQRSSSRVSSSKQRAT